MLTAAYIEAAYKTLRAQVPTVAVRHKATGALYTATRAAPLAGGLDVSAHGALQQGRGGIRLCVSELQPPLPKAGDRIELIETPGGEPISREIIETRYDQARATVLIQYQEQYGG